MNAPMRTVWLGLCLGLLCLTTVAAGELPHLRLASDVWPPFTDVAKKPHRAVDLVHGALERAGLKANTDIRSWDTVLRGLRKGDFDGTVAMWRTRKREGFMRFSKPYMENRLVLVGRNGTDVTATKLDQLKGKRVALVRGYAYGPDVERARGPIFVRGTSDEENFRSLLQGKVDYLLADELLTHYLFERHQRRAKRLLQVGITTLVKRSLHFAVRRKLPGGEGLLQRFDAQIAKMMADGSYNRILKVGWIRTDVDGDGRAELVGAGTGAGGQAPKDGYEIIEPKGIGQAAEPDPRFVIDGKVYESWDSVPGRYKVEPETTPERTRSGWVLFEF